MQPIELMNEGVKKLGQKLTESANNKLNRPVRWKLLSG